MLSPLTLTLSAGWVVSSGGAPADNPTQRLIFGANVQNFPAATDPDGCTLGQLSQ